MADQPTTTGQLLDLMRSLFPAQDKRDIDVTELRYVIYARKSTKGEERQERSIQNQISDCMKREVIPNELKVIGKPIKEEESAKEPDIRPKFRDMLEDIKSGKIDGIIAWHPDRLSRNMKEAGEIIDLLDKGVLKDLRFATSTFENSPTGKMLLGISFVLSKQYSEHLSESVSRGNRRKIEDGIFFDEMKHGYYIQDGRLFPDGDNFLFIKQAFEKRLAGAPQMEIARWLNSTGYRVRKKGKRSQLYTWTKDNVSKLLRDTIYTGVLRYGTNFVDLTEFYDFQAAISVDNFLRINHVKDLGDPKLLSSIMVKSRDTTKADLLRGIVYCGYCHKPFGSGITPKKLVDGTVRNYYYYRCITEGCPFINKSIRAKVVIDHATHFLGQHLFTTESNYEHYVDEAKDYAAVQAHQLDSNIAALTKQIGNKEAEYERTKATIRDNPSLARHYNLDEIENELKAIRSDHAKLVDARKRIKQSVLTYSQYFELFQSIGVILRENHDMEVLDETLRKFFTNYEIKDLGRGKKQRYKISCELKKPWSEFIKTGNFDNGRGERT